MQLTFHELVRLMTAPLMPAFYGKVCRDLRILLKETPVKRVSLLDVGGRKSPYTIGLKSDITVLDLPRKNDVQKSLKLGLTNEILKDLQYSRSNIKKILLQDMSKCTLPSESFDGVVCVEVIEHVKEVSSFLFQVERVLKPQGWLYLTTPNGDYIRIVKNPDHVRHYTRQELYNLLSMYFAKIIVTYGIRTGKYRVHGIKPMNFRHPLALFQTMTCNIMNRIESRGLEHMRQRTAHLFAVARKT